MEIVRDSSDIEEIIQLAEDSLEKGSEFAGMSYEEGILALYNWLVGHQDEPPLE